jgi:hypothetical protein
MLAWGSKDLYRVQLNQLTAGPGIQGQLVFADFLTLLTFD